MHLSRLIPGLIAIALVGGFAGITILASPNSRVALVDEADDPLSVLKSATSLELFSLDPQQHVADGENYFGWKILGKTTPSDAKCKALTGKLIKGLNEKDITMAKCFIPRHGIRIKQNEKVYDFVICFQCSQIRCYVDGERQKKTVPVGKTPTADFNKVLTDAGVKLPRQY